jgi:hypothetical protein
LQEQFEKIVPAVVETLFDFLKIHGKMIFGNASVIVEDIFAERPKTLMPLI